MNEKSKRSTRARIGAYSLHAQHDSKELTAKARETFLSRFENEVDPDGTLPLEERARRAAAARKAYFTNLGRMSGKSKGAKK